MSVLGGQLEWSLAVGLRVHVGVVGEEQLDYGGVAL